MFAPKRQPTNDSLRDRILRFFEQNPGEELTFTDVMTKFDVGRRTAEGALYRMRECGELESAHVWRRRAS